MLAITVWMDDHKLLKESNVTAWQPRRAPIMLYILFNKCHQANEGLVNLTGDAERELGSPAPRARCYPLPYGPP